MVYLLIGLTLLFSNELEVEGSLKVTGGIDAQGQSVSNVGNPVLESDATNLSTVRSMMGVKPDRIYSFERDYDVDFSFTVPEGKLWIIQMFNSEQISINGTDYNVGSEKFSILPGWTLGPASGEKNLLNIYEYSISGSGTEQGMDYIVP